MRLLENIRNISRQNGADAVINGKNGICSVCKVKKNNIIICNILKEKLMGKSDFDQKKCLFEALGNGYTDTQVFGSIDGYPYCIYQILPLTHAFEQKVSMKSKMRNMKNRPVKLNDFVEGNDIFKPHKTYMGLVKKFRRDEYNDIVAVVILDIDSGKFRVLSPDSVHFSAPFPVSRRPIKWINSASMNIPNSIGGGHY